MTSYCKYVKNVLSSNENAPEKIMSGIEDGLDKASIDYTTNEKKNEFVIPNSTKKEITKIIKDSAVIADYLIKILVDVIESKGVVYVRLKMK